MYQKTTKKLYNYKFTKTENIAICTIQLFLQLRRYAQENIYHCCVLKVNVYAKRCYKMNTSVLTIRSNLFDPVSLFVFIYDTIQVKPHCLS